jgi:hypothetical protein
MEIQRNVSRWPWMQVTNMLVCNIEANAGEATLLESMERDQIVNVT